MVNPTITSPGHRAEREGPRKKSSNGKARTPSLLASRTAALQAISPGTESALGEALHGISSDPSDVTDLHARNMAGSLPDDIGRTFQKLAGSYVAKRVHCANFDTAIGSDLYLRQLAYPMQADHGFRLDGARAEFHD